MSDLVSGGTPKKPVSAADVGAIMGGEGEDEEGSDTKGKKAGWHVDGTTPKDATLDDEALKEIEAERERLCNEIDRAKENCDTAAIDRLTIEKQELLDYLRRNTRLGGNPRGIASGTDRLRGTIGDSLKEAYKKLCNSNPSLDELADHFSCNIRADGPTYIYDPHPAPSWSFDKKGP
jgi:hypothetical protein